MRVLVSIVTFGDAVAQVELACEALAAQTLGPVSVWVLCNAGNRRHVDALRAALRCRTPDLHVQVRWRPDNLGFTGGHNVQAREAFADGFDVVVVHNPDLVLTPMALSELLQEQLRQARPVLLGPLLELADPRSLLPEGHIDSAGIRWTRDGRHFDAQQGELIAEAPSGPAYEVSGVSGACLWVPRAAYDILTADAGELFDDNFLAYREDAELGVRARCLGVRSVIVPCAGGRHGRGLRGSSRGNSTLVDLLGVQNRFLMKAKLGPLRPGLPLCVVLRDAVVVGGVLLVERGSASGLLTAWRLRRTQGAKGRALRTIR